MAQNQLRIASYNIRKARGLDQRRRPQRILEVVNALNADVVLLQEADKRLGARPPAIERNLIAQETEFDLVEVSRNGLSLGWHGNAVLVRKGIMVDDVKVIDLPGLEPRGAVQVNLDIAGGMSVVGAHLGLMRRNRRAQLDVLCRTTRDSARVVIAGDFNEWSNEVGLEPLASRFAVTAPGKSFHARRPIAGLDRFALSEGVTLQDAGVSQDAPARRASDHLPIWFDISVA